MHHRLILDIPILDILNDSVQDVLDFGQKCMRKV